VELAQAAEAAGFDSIWTVEQVVVPHGRGARGRRVFEALALALGASPRNVTSRYDGTALIAAAHLGHDGVVRALILAGAPLDHVNNLGWTALIEAVILGDGGPRHVATVRALVDAGARRGLADRQGTTALAHARQRRYDEIVRILEAGGR
jgi:ankyrin repeat protein